MGPAIVNVGLPRTGTTSFAAATELLGFRSLHVWSEAQHDARVYGELLENSPSSRRFLGQFNSLSDTPFYGLRAHFEKHYPATVLCYSTRNRDAWVESMVNYRTGGGEYLARLYGVDPPPYHADRLDDLRYIYDQHHRLVCSGLPVIDLDSGDDDQKWAVLCSALPDGAALLESMRGVPWPSRNSWDDVQCQRQTAARQRNAKPAALGFLKKLVGYG